MSRHLPHIVFVCVYVVVVVVVSSCKEHQLTTDTSARLTFSADTVNFDTVFTAAGSSTQCIMVYNHNANALRISRMWWQNGQHFFANFDGENNSDFWQDMQIDGGDSLFLFIRAEIDPYGTNAHPIEYDTLWFELNGQHQGIVVQAFGLDVERLHPDTTPYYDFHFLATRPYLLYDTLRIGGTLTIDPGTTIYMHNGASIIAYGSVLALGTPDQPIRVMGDRTDYLFPKVPYRVASGQWGGIYLMHYDSLCPGEDIRYQLSNIHLLSGQVGLFCYGDNPDRRAALALHNARIHNMSAYGIVLENTDALISNAEISNCASFGLFLCGGNHLIEHTSVANFFGYPYTTLNIHNTTRQQVAAVYVQATSSDMAPSVSSFYNSIITGAVHPALVFDSLPETGYPGHVAGCYLRCDSDSIAQYSWAHSNTFAHDDDSVFVNTYYKYGEYIYYDFHLSAHSVAQRIGLPLDSLSLDVTSDLQGLPRDPSHPDAGCYTSKQ